MPNRRILSLWFPRLGAERLLRLSRGTIDVPLAVVRDENNMQVIASASGLAAAEGITAGMALRDATAVCPTLLTRKQDAPAEAAFLAGLRRWAGKFSPWVAEAPPDGLVIDLTGCAHLFGGEASLMEQAAADCQDLGLSVQAGIADTLGAAWALARFAQGAISARSGDAIDQEAYATRARAAKRRRHWTKGGAAPNPKASSNVQGRIAPPGGTRAAIAPLPITALRLSEAAITGLARLGVRQVGDLAGLPRAATARRFGRDVVDRLDQALGVTPEPVSPARAPDHFAVRLSFPDPIGLEADILAAIDRLLEPLCDKLRTRGRGARRVRLQAMRVDQASEVIEVGLARPAAEPDRIRPLLSLKVGDIDSGFGIDVLRIEVTAHEPVHNHTHAGHAEAAALGVRRKVAQAEGVGIDDLIGRLGARVGLEAITRLHPADSHIPEKTATVMGAAWVEPAQEWPEPDAIRPLLMWPPEPVMADDDPMPPVSFRWRGQTHALAEARGPERIAPEWWLDDPAWRSGLRDYWQVVTEKGDRLWLYYAHGGEMSAGWFAQGRFA